MEALTNWIASLEQTQQPPKTTFGTTLLRPPGLGLEEIEDVTSFPTNAMFCPQCGFSSTSRFHYNSHMNTHKLHQCTQCSYQTRTEGRLKKHAQESHPQEIPPQNPANMAAYEEANNNGNGIPRTSSNKPKRFKTPKKCKHCPHISHNKAEFWAHLRQHIPVEKQLNCILCGFVTGYRHHLEYHYRNHAGKKPFMCYICDYTCINKSMLNSHLKSHADGFPYSCQDCTYETKYLHIFKQHLRKYNHKCEDDILSTNKSRSPLEELEAMFDEQQQQHSLGQIDKMVAAEWDRPNNFCASNLNMTAASSLADINPLTSAQNESKERVSLNASAAAAHAFHFTDSADSTQLNPPDMSEMMADDVQTFTLATQQTTPHAPIVSQPPVLNENAVLRQQLESLEKEKRQWGIERNVLLERIEMYQLDNQRMEEAIREAALKQAMEKSLNALERENRELREKCTQLEQKVAQPEDMEDDDDNRSIEWID